MTNDYIFVENSLYLKDETMKCFELIEKEKLYLLFNNDIEVFYLDQIKKEDNYKILIWNSIPNSIKNDLNNIIEDRFENYCFFIDNSSFSGDFEKNCFVVSKDNTSNKIEDLNLINDYPNNEVVLNNNLPFNLRYDVYSITKDKNRIFLV